MILVEQLENKLDGSASVTLHQINKNNRELWYLDP